jgi:hypothetical protein
VLEVLTGEKMTNGDLYRLLELLSKFDCEYELDRTEHDAMTTVLYIVGREYYTKGADDDV